MTLRFAYTRPDGGVSIVNAVPKAHLDRLFGDELTEEQYRAVVIARLGLAPDVQLVELPDDWTPPDDRSFRGAWQLKKGAVKVDMRTARQIHMDRIRRARNARLAERDIDSMRAIGSRDERLLAQTEAAKQGLRDVPQRLDLTRARTPAALQARWPEELR
jgi:hypothetical protein